jgi:hypothetical protein
VAGGHSARDQHRAGAQVSERVGPRPGPRLGFFWANSGSDRVGNRRPGRGRSGHGPTR